MNYQNLESLIKKLPDCPGILAREKFFNSAVLVPLVFMENEFHLIFEKRASGIRQGSEICFPGGMHDPSEDKDATETAVRETTEELGISRKKIDVLGRFDTLVASMGVMVDPVLAVITLNDISELNVNRDEVEDVFTLPVSFFLKNKVESYNVRLVVEPCYTDRNGNEITLLPAKELGLPKLYHKPWGKAYHRVLVYRTPKGIIWGITAEIIYDMLNKIEQ